MPGRVTSTWTCRWAARGGSRCETTGMAWRRTICRSRFSDTRPARSRLSMTCFAWRRSASAARRCRALPPCLAWKSPHASRTKSRPGEFAARVAAPSKARLRRRTRRARRQRSRISSTTCRRGENFCARRKPSSATCSTSCIVSRFRASTPRLNSRTTDGRFYGFPRRVTTTDSIAWPGCSVPTSRAPTGPSTPAAPACRCAVGCPIRHFPAVSAICSSSSSTGGRSATSSWPTRCVAASRTCSCTAGTPLSPFISTSTRRWWT